MSEPLIYLVDDNKELADLLAQILDDAGYRPKVYYRGRLALDALGREKPALAVIDLLLPDLVGYEVAKEFKAAEVPFILVTGVFKGAKHSFEARTRHGAVGWFEKPFEATRLLEAISAVVPPGAKKTATRQTFEVELDIDVDERDYTPTQPLEMTGRINVMGTSVNAVLTGNDFALEQATAGQKIVRTGGARQAEAQEQAEGARSSRAPRVGAMLPVSAGGTSAVALSADGKSRRGVLDNNLPQLIAAFWQLQETGELGLQRGKVKKVIYFEKGQPVFALSNLAADRFGTFLVRVGKITEAQLKTATDAAMSQKRRTGDVLIEMGLLQETERMYYVAQQVKSILYSVFAWQEGEYVMTFQSKARREPIRLGIHPAQLISRGIKKLYSPGRQQRMLAKTDVLIPSEDPAFQLTEVDLEAWEALLLSRIDGNKDVSELLEIADKPAEQVYGTLVTLLALKIVEKRA